MSPRADVGVSPPQVQTIAQVLAVNRFPSAPFLPLAQIRLVVERFAGVEDSRVYEIEEQFIVQPSRF